METMVFRWFLGQATIGNGWFSMVVHHWSDDGMVKYHRTGLFYDMGLVIVYCMGSVNSKIALAVEGETRSQKCPGGGDKSLHGLLL